MRFMGPTSDVCFGSRCRAVADPRRGRRRQADDAAERPILIHQPSSGFQGQTSDIEIHAREVLELRRRTEEIYAEHTGQPVEQLHADMERDRFFSAAEAVDYGLVDRVVEHRRLPSRAPAGFSAAAES